MRRLLPRIGAVLLLISTGSTFAEPPSYTSEQLSLIRYTAECQLSPDGIYFLRNENGATSLGFVRSPPAHPQTVLPAVGVVREISLDRAGKKLALLREDVARPADVWIVDRPASPGLPPQMAERTPTLAKAFDRSPSVSWVASKQKRFRAVRW
jgi:hypothetical protein